MIKTWIFRNFYPQLNLNYRLLYDIFNVCYPEGLYMLIVQLMKGIQPVQFSFCSPVVATCSHRLPIFEKGFYFLKSIKRNTKTRIEQIWLVSIQDPLWRIIRPTAMYMCVRGLPVSPIIAYTWRLCPKGEPFWGFYWGLSKTGNSLLK